MLGRKSSRPFLICSLIIHLIAALIMIQMQSEQRQISSFDGSVVLDITHISRPTVRPHVKVKPTSPPLPAEPVEAVQEVSAPKPRLASAADWLTVDALKINQRMAIVAKIDSPVIPGRVGLAPQPRFVPTARPNSRALAHHSSRSTERRFRKSLALGST